MRPTGVDGSDHAWRMKVDTREETFPILAALMHPHDVIALTECWRKHPSLTDGLAAGYKRLPVLKRRLRVLAYTSVCPLPCIHRSRIFCNAIFKTCVCARLLQVIVWAVLTVLQTLPFWQALKPFWPQGRTSLMHLTFAEAGRCPIALHTVNIAWACRHK